ncbi:MAG: hypothetical protein JWR22_2802 [Herminiimonas sp.]|nr:hypothetical protein [Herminiimonas sp.]
MKTLTLIGAGNLGRTLARLWADSGAFHIQDVACRRVDSAKRAVAFIGVGRPCAGMAELASADVFLIAVPDDALVESARQLASSGLVTPNSIVFHCSGSRCASEMTSVVQTGAAVASIHPVRSFARPEEVLKSFPGTYCGTEGDVAALSVLKPAFESIGAVLVPIEARHKMLYHAAAVFASNYLVTVIDMAVQAYAAAGVPRDVALPMLAPLVRNAVENVFLTGSDGGPEAALSGPIARGDMDTVGKQYRALRDWDIETATLYRQLARRTVRLARRRNGN